MKRIVSLLAALVLLLSCSAASAEAFSDLFTPFPYMTATLDKATDDCFVKPTVAAMNNYATDGNVILPWFAQQSKILMAAIVMKGAGAMHAPQNVMIVTDDYTYRLTLKENAPIGTIDIEGQSFNVFMLATELTDMMKDIAESDTVLVRFSKDLSFFDDTDFVLGAEAKAIFGAVYEAYVHYDAVIDYPMGDILVAMTVNAYCSYEKEKNTSSVWD